MGTAPTGGSFPVEFYNSGADILVDLEILKIESSNGFNEFELCETNEDYTVTHACFTHRLSWSNTGITTIPTGDAEGAVTYSLKLPPNVECLHCVLRWKWTGKIIKL